MEFCSIVLFDDVGFVWWKEGIVGLVWCGVVWGGGVCGVGVGSIHCFCWGWSWSSSEYSSEDEEDPPPKNFDIPKLNFKLCVVVDSDSGLQSVAMGPLQGGGGNEFVTGWIIVGEGIGWRRG